MKPLLDGPFAQARVLTGPTGSGKTRLALDLAKQIDAEIVSMDSMALYRGMDIGTAKPTPEQLREVPHHLIDRLDPWESANVAWWLAEAANACRDITGRGKTPLFVGGTPLYLKALLFGLFDGPSADPAVRARLEAEAAAVGNGPLHARLAAVDPAAATKIHVNDLRRIIRALEVFELTGKPMSAWQQQWPTPTASADSTAIQWIDWPRSVLHERIDRRVDAMFADGLVEEVKQLLALPRPLSKEANQALGYKETTRHLTGELSLADTIEAVKAHTRQFAKRQVTWFRHLPGCRPLKPVG